MAAQPIKMCKVGRNIIRKALPRTYPQWKIDLGREIIDVFERHPHVLVMHYNAMNSKDWIDFRYNMRQEKVFVKKYPNKITKVFLAQTIYANLGALFCADTCVAYGNDVSMKGVLRQLESTPKMMLMGGKIETTLMNRQQIIAYSKLPSIQQMHAELAFLLSQPASRLSTLLEANPSLLSVSLQQYAKQLAE